MYAENLLRLPEPEQTTLHMNKEIIKNINGKKDHKHHIHDAKMNMGDEMLTCSWFHNKCQKTQQ